MKTPAQLRTDITRRLGSRWHTHLAGVETVFPHTFPLGQVSSAQMRTGYAEVHVRTLKMQEWARAHGIELRTATRRAQGGTTQIVPTHAVVSSIDHAAAIAGDEWQDRLARSRTRLSVLERRDIEAEARAKALRILDGGSGLDFDLTLQVADWFLADPERAHLRVTPRQVPIPGVHTKWLQNHTQGILALTGLDDLGLLPRHPSRIHFTYLDPDHLARGGRRHDSATVDDTMTPAYVPRVVMISENKDTAIYFPQVQGGIAVEGVGAGGRTPAAFPWIREAPHLVYWGDIDADGYEILAGYRAAMGRDIDSMLMDEATYERYQAFGTDTDQHGHVLGSRPPRSLEGLRVSEQQVYLRLIDEHQHGPRRIEQERIPLADAIVALERSSVD